MTGPGRAALALANHHEAIDIDPRMPGGADHHEADAMGRSIVPASGEHDHLGLIRRAMEADGRSVDVIDIDLDAAS